MTDTAATPTPQPEHERRTIILGRQRFYNEATAYLIATANDADTGESFTVKGEILAPQFGEKYEVFGRFVVNERFGVQDFAFTSARLMLPDSRIGIERFLAKSLHGVGPAIAARIVEAYGEQALEILSADPSRVAREITGISEAGAAGISEWLREHARETALRLELETMVGGVQGIPTKTPDNAIEEWGDDAPAVIRSNPYSLTELPGIGFKRADELAIARFGYARDGIARRKAAILYVLAEQAATNGHTVVPDSDLIRSTVNLIGYEPGEDALRELSDAGAIVAHVGEVQLAGLALAEKVIADRISVLSAATANVGRTGFTLGAELVESLSESQRAAVAATVGRSRISLLTGAPGTGKTYTVARIVAAARRAGYSVHMVAPTGKASKRITEHLSSAGLPELAGLTARTIHRMLGATIHAKTGEWQYAITRQNPFGARSLFVVDEFSMVDTLLAARFLDAVHVDSIVLLVGDPHQLPSIGAGAVLRDAIAAGTVPHAELTEIRRNAGDLVQALHAIKDGRIGDVKFSPRLDLTAESPQNLRMIESDESELYSDLLEVIQRMQARGFDPIWDVQVMAPLNDRGGFSCDALNPLLAQALNPTADSHKGLAFRVGDKVVRSKNGTVAGRYHDPADRPDTCEPGYVDVVNGDIGRVESITEKTIAVRHWSPDRTAEYPRREHKLRLAYCLTVHKMQGSSAPIALLPMHESFVGPIWSREWIYTAISRAEKAAILVGSEEVARRAMMRPGGNRRKTRLVGLMRPPVPAAAEALGVSELEPAPETPAVADPVSAPRTDLKELPDLNELLDQAAAGDSVDWFDSNMARGALPLHPDGGTVTLPDGRRVWLHPEERL